MQSSEEKPYTLILSLTVFSLFQHDIELNYFMSTEQKRTECFREYITCPQYSSTIKKEQLLVRKFHIKVHEQVIPFRSLKFRT